MKNLNNCITEISVEEMMEINGGYFSLEPIMWPIKFIISLFL